MPKINPSSYPSSDLAVERVTRIRVGLGGFFERLPSFPAVMRFERRFLQPHREAVLGVDKPDARDQTSGGRDTEFVIRFFLFAEPGPTAARFLGEPDRRIGDHPSDSVVQKEQRSWMILERHLGPVLAAVAGDQGNVARSLFRIELVVDRAHGDAALGRRESQILHHQRVVIFVEKVLDFPAFGPHQGRKQH